MSSANLLEALASVHEHEHEPASSSTSTVDALVAQLVALADEVLAPTERVQPGASPAVDLARQQHSSDRTSSLSRHARRVARVQRALLSGAWEEWGDAFEAREHGLGELVCARLIVPPRDASTGAASLGAAQVASSTYELTRTLLRPGEQATTLPNLRRLTRALAPLPARYGFDALYPAVFALEKATEDVPSAGEGRESVMRLVTWRQLVDDMLALPARLANAWGRLEEAGKARVSEEVPDELQERVYMSMLSRSFERFVRVSSTSGVPSSVQTEALAGTLQRLLGSSGATSAFVNAIAPPLFQHITPPTTMATVDALKTRLNYAQTWQALIAELSPRRLEQFFVAIVQALERAHALALLSSRPSDRRLIRAATITLRELFGPLDNGNEMPDVLLAAVLGSGRAFPLDLAALMVYWAMSSGESALCAMLKRASEAWTDTQHIEVATESRRIFLTAFVLRLIMSLPERHQALVRLSRSREFLSAVTAHLSILKPTTRLLGMLTAEIVSARTVDPSAADVKPLSFGEAAFDSDATIKHLREWLAAHAKPTEEDRADVARFLQLWKQGEIRVIPARQSTKSARLPTPLQPRPQADAPKKPLISIIDNEEDDLVPMQLPEMPPESHLETLRAEDPSLYATAMPSASASTATRRRGKLRPPVYIAELTAYVKAKDPEGKDDDNADIEAERVELGLKHGEALVRRKAHWGTELTDNAVDLAITLCGLQDQYEVEDFERLRTGILGALVASAPRLAAPAVIEHYFTPHYSIAMRFDMLTALASGARELAGMSPLIASAPDTDAFPSKTLPPALHAKLIGGNGEQGAVDRLAQSIADDLLVDTRESAQTSIPEAARERLFTVRQSAASTRRTAAGTLLQASATYADLAADYFVMPLVNRLWLYMRDASTASSHSALLGGTMTLLEPLSLSKLLATLAVLAHAARHSPYFTSVIAPELVELALALRTGAASQEESNEQVVATQLELMLVVFTALDDLDGGRHFLQRLDKGAQLAVDTQIWAQQIFDEDDKRGKAVVGRAGRAAAGVLLRLEDILTRWRGLASW